MKITINFNDDYIEYLREKFEIETEDDLRSVIFECIDTYMEL